MIRNYFAISLLQLLFLALPMMLCQVFLFLFFLQPMLDYWLQCLYEIISYCLACTFMFNNTKMLAVYLKRSTFS